MDKIIKIFRDEFGKAPWTIKADLILSLLFKGISWAAGFYFLWSFIHRFFTVSEQWAVFVVFFSWIANQVFSNEALIWLQNKYDRS